MARSPESQMDTLESRKPRHAYWHDEAPELRFTCDGDDRGASVYTGNAIHTQGMIAAPLSRLQTLSGRLNKKIILKSGVRANNNHSTSRRGPLPFPASYPPVIS